MTNPQASAHSIRSLFLMGQFEPARTQRDYQWEEPQWKALLSDLVSVLKRNGPATEQDQADHEADPEDDVRADEDDSIEEGAQPPRPIFTLNAPPPMPSFYLGHILLMRRQAEDRFFIYDGQQRLTTLTLLLCALRDASQDNAWLEIQEVLRTPQPQMAARVKIQTPGRALARIGDALNGCTTRAHNTASLADRRMHEAARFFLEEVRTWPSTMRIDFATFLLDRTFLTVTQMRDRHMAEFAYITINTRGKPLENKDIIKGHFVQLASQSSLTAANEMSDAWGRLERMAGHRLDGILRVAFLLDFRQPPSSDFSARLMDHFNQPEHLEGVKTWVAERLPALIQNHKQLVLQRQRETILPAPASHLRRMTFLPWTHWQAIVLRLAERDANAPQRFKRSIAVLEQWCFSTNLLNFSEDEIAHQVIRALDAIDRQPQPTHNNSRLQLSADRRAQERRRLRDGQITDFKRRGAHVRWMETLYWDAAEVNFSATNGSSVEHVLPQHATGQWLADFPSNIHIHTEQFGNLCLLQRQLGDDLGHSQYADKRPAYQKLSPAYKSAHDVANAETWGMASIQQRTERLAQRAETALGLV